LTTSALKDSSNAMLQYKAVGHTHTRLLSRFTEICNQGLKNSHSETCSKRGRILTEDILTSGRDCRVPALLSSTSNYASDLQKVSCRPRVI